ILTAVNGARLNASPERTTTRCYAEARCRFAFGMSMLSAGTPMFLFGEEVGTDKDFLYNKVLDNREDLRTRRQDTARPLFQYSRDLTRLRLDHSALRAQAIDVLYVHNLNRLLAFRRYDPYDDLLVLASLNNRPFSLGYVIENQRIPNGSWREI